MIAFFLLSLSHLANISKIITWSRTRFWNVIKVFPTIPLSQLRFRSWRNKSNRD